MISMNMKNFSNRAIEKRIEALEKRVGTATAIVRTRFPEDKTSQKIPFADFIKRCREDSVIYKFKIVGNTGTMKDIDSLISLIDDYAFDRL